jgi:hypothetical protein
VSLLFPIDIGRTSEGYDLRWHRSNNGGHGQTGAGKDSDCRNTSQNGTSTIVSFSRLQLFTRPDGLGSTLRPVVMPINVNRPSVPSGQFSSAAELLCPQSSTPALHSNSRDPYPFHHLHVTLTTHQSFRRSSE